MYKTKLSEKFVIAILIAFNLWIYNVDAQDCDALDYPALTFVVIPITPGTLLAQPLEIRVANTNGVISHTENPSNENLYFSFTYVSDIVLVETTTEFLNYEIDQDKTELIATVRLTCADNQQTSMIVTFEFQDVNNWDPQFSKPSYEIEIPLPLPKGVEIFSFITETISAIDNDLKNNQIKFTSDITDQPFSVGTSSLTGTLGKQFFATILTTEKILNIRDGIEFYIIATDSGTDRIGTAIANVKLTSQSDDESPVEVPIFHKTLYIGTLDFRQSTPLQIETISLVDETFIPTIAFATEFIDANYFQMTQVTGENAIDFYLDENITEDNLNGQTQLSFVVKAIRPDGLSGNAAVLITVIPRDSLVFDNTLYTGTIKPEMTIAHEPIKLTDSSYQTGVVFSIKEDILGWFEVVSNPNVNEIQIQLIRPLSDTDLEGKTLASLTLLATNPENTVLEAESHVVLGIEVAELITPTFEFSFYEGSISTDLELKDLPDLRLTNLDIGNVEFTLSDYNDLFEAVKTTDGVQIIKKTITADDVEDKNTLRFTVTATSDKSITGSTVVILTVEHEELILPVFAQPTYIGYLRRPISADSFQLEDVILNSHPGVVQFALSGEDTHLIKIVSEEMGNRIVTLGLADGVTEDEIGDRNVLSVIVTAKLTETIIGSTVVIIHVDQEEIVLKQPAFEKNIYHGSLTESYELLMEDTEIKITQATFSDTIVFTEIGDDAQYFIVQKTDGVNTVEIEWNPNASLEELADRKALSFSVVATSFEDQILTGTTTVVIELAPKVVSPEKIPAFQEHLYAGSVKADLTIDLEPIHIATETLTPDISYELIGFDSDLFYIVEIAEGTIEIRTNKITADILKTKQLFKFMVRAENEEQHIGITSVVIEVPRELVSEVIVPQFERSLYNGKMTRDEIVKLDEIIKITESTYSSNLKFTVDGGDSSLFEVTNHPGSNIIEVSMKSFEPSALQGKNVLYFAVIGTLTDNIIVTTSVVIDITPVVTLHEPKFEQPLYVGVLSAEMTFGIGDLVITADSYSSDLEFEKSGRDSDLFEMTVDVNKIKITPVRPITEDDIAYLTNLQFTVTAIKQNGLYGSTAIVVDIPVKAIGDVILPQFESPYYKGVLTAAFEIELSTVVLIDTTYNSKVQFAVTDEMFYLFEMDNVITVSRSLWFDESAFKDKQVHSFAIIAHLGSTIQGTTTIILEIESPNEKLVPQFEESLYTGDLSADLIPSIPIIKLTEESYSTEVVFALEPGFDSNLFTLDTSTTGNVVQILSNGLTEDNTKLKSSLKFVLTATKSEKLIGNTVIVIKNPNVIVDNIIVPKFDKLVYTGSISPDFALTIDDIIKITDATYSPLITYHIEGGNELFKVTGQNANLITIGLDHELQQSDINDKKVFSFTLVASLGDLAQGTATIVIDVQLQNVILPPEFEQSLYVGSLTDTLRLIIVDLKLTAESYSTNVNFELVNAFDSELFSINPTGNNIQITSNGITEIDILLRPVLKFIIRATKLNNLVGTTVVVINIPQNIVDDILIPEFQNSIYAGSLSTALELNFNEIIQVTDSTYSSAVRFKLEDGNSDLFQIINEIENEFTIKLSRPLDESDIGTLKVLSFTIVASVGEYIRGTSAVIIDIETPDTVEYLEFKQSLYVGSLDTDLVLHFDEEIMLTTDSYSDDVIFDLVEAFDSAFVRPSYVENLVTFVLEGVNDENMKSRNVLTFVISAERPDNAYGTTVVMINIQKLPEKAIIPEFKQLIYRDKLSAEMDQFSIAVQITAATPGITFTLKEDGDSNLFRIVNQNNEEAQIELFEPLEASDIQDKTILSFIVEASLETGYSGTTTVIIDIPDPNAVQPPVFVQSLYVGSLNNDLSLNFNDQIMLTDDSYSAEVTFSLVNEFDSNFVKLASSGNLVSFTLDGFSEDDLKSKNVLTFVIIATKSDNLYGTTVVIIHIPQALQGELIIPEFKESIYRGLLSDLEKFDIDVAITAETVTPGITFTLKDGDSNLFRIANQNNEGAQIELFEPLEVTDIQDRKILSFTVEASLETGYKGTTTVIIDIPDPNAVQPPVFVQSLYVGSLNNDLSLNFNDQIMLTDDSYSAEVTFSLVNEFDSNFVKLASSGNLVSFTLEGFSEDDLKSKNVLTFVIIATKSDNLYGTTVVIIHIPQALQGELIIPEFKESIYRGLLSELDKFDIDVAITAETVTLGITFTLKDGDSNLFRIANQNNEGAQIELFEPLEVTDIQDRKILSFTVEASLETGYKGTTTVIIDIPDPNAVQPPVFVQSLYVGSLNNDLSLNFNDQIMLTDDSYSAEVTFSLVNEFDSNFVKLASSGNLVSFTLDGFTEDDLKSKNVLTFVIIATKSDNLYGTTVVIIHIPQALQGELIIPEFKESIYRGLLSELDKFDIDVAITAETVTLGITFTLKDGDSNLFRIANQNNEGAQIELFEPLEVTDIQDRKILSFTVEASLETGYKGTTTVIIDIPDPNAVQPPVFVQSLYVGSLNNDLSLNFNDQIMLTDDSYSAEVTFGLVDEFDSNFVKLASSGNLVSFTLDGFTEDDLKSKNVLTFVIIATKSDNLYGTTVVIIHIPQALQGELIIPEFKESIYRGLLSELDKFDIDVAITAETVTPGITFTLKDGDSNLFRIANQNNEGAQIELFEPLEVTDIQDRKILSFTVEASLETGYKGTTTVIIDIPDPNAVQPPVFVQSLYVGSLNNDLSLNFNDQIMLTDDSYSAEVTFSLVNEFDSNFVKLASSGNLVSFTLDGFTEDDLKSKNVLTFVIIATKSDNLYGTTVVIIHIPQALQGELIIPEFKESIYRGLLSELDKFDIDVAITAETVTLGITFTLKDGDSNLFRIANQNNEGAQIELFEPLEVTDIQDRKILSFTVEASLETGYKGTTTVIIDIPDPNAVQPPVFVQSLYVGSLNNDLSLNFNDQIMLTDDSYSAEVTFGLVDEFDSNFVKLASSGNLVSFTLDGFTEDDLKSKNVLTFVIIATKSDNIYGTTVVIIHIPQALQGELIIPEFKESIYRGLLSGLDKFDIDVAITAETVTPGITFTLKDGDSNLFRIANQNNEGAQIELFEPLEVTDIQDRKILSFTVEASLETGYKGTTTVIIDIPDPNAVQPPVFVQSLYVGSLNNDLSLNFNDQIMLTDDSYSAEVTFSLVNEFDSNFVKLASSGNLVSFTLDGFTEDDLKSKNVLTFVIIATKSDNIYGTTVVIIHIPQALQGELIIPEFKESIYRGLLSGLDKFDIDVAITAETVTPGITFTLKDGDSNLFRIANQNNEGAQIELFEPLEVTDIQDRKILSFTVEASLETGYKGTTTVIIDIPDPNAVQPPVFVQSLYVGSLNNDLSLNFNDQIMLTDDSYSAEVTFGLVDEYDHNLFEIANTGNRVSINLKDLSEEDIKSKSALMVLISATKSKTNVGTTVLIVEIQLTSIVDVIVPRFEEPLYVLILSTDLMIENIDPIKVDIATYSSDIIIGLSGADHNLFIYDRNDNEIMVKTARDLTTNDVESKQVLSLIITAALPTGEEGSTVVLLEIPFEGCHIPDETTRPKFENELYSNSIAPDATGVIRRVYAEVPRDSSIKVIYAVQIEDTGLSSKIEMNRDSGELSVTDRLAIDVYSFVLTATNPEDNTVGYATIHLTVTSDINCAGEPIVSHALIVRHLDEETPHTNIFDATINVPNCEYSIATATPSSLRDIFEIDGNLLISQSFDRENIIFEDMMIPQIRLMLEIVCSVPETLNGKYMSISYNQTRATRSIKDDLDDPHYIYTSDIERDDKKTIISIVIKDINDNDPVFEIPSSDVLIGYPESQLAEKLLPPYLTKVYATDADDGINSKILYTIDPNTHFGINGETGVIYPLKNSMDDTLEYDLIVKAIDEEGAGRATSLNIKVKRLGEKNFIVISIENESLDNLDTILGQIETESGLRINVLNAVIVSTATEGSTELRSKRSTQFADDEETILRIVGYAFNVDGVPIENEELETELSNLATAYIITTQSLIELIGDCEEPVCPSTEGPDDCETGDCDECDNIGLMVGIIVMAILFLLACIACFVMWWKWIRPYRYIKRDSTNDRLDHDFNDTGYTEPVRAATAPVSDSDILGKSNFEIKNENAPTQVTPAISHSSPTSLAKSLQSVLDQETRKPSLVLDKDNLSGSSETDDSGSPPLRERKKSIKFNETVERIDILDDVTEKEDTTF